MALALNNADPDAFKSFSEKYKDLGRILYRDGVLSFIVIRNVFNQKKLSSIADNIAVAFNDAINNFGFLIINTCKVCNTPNCDTYQVIDGVIYCVHNQCKINSINSQISEIYENESKGNYLTGAIGGLIGAFLGAIPSIIVIVAFSRISAWLFALIPIVSYYGYTLLNGKRKNFMMVFIVIFTLISTIFSYNFAMYFTLSATYGGISLSEFSTIISMISTEYLEDLLKCILFSGIGVLLSWRLISNTTNKQLKKIQSNNSDNQQSK